MKTRDQKKREFATRLGMLVMDDLAHNLNPDDLLEVLRAKVREEESIRESRLAAARTY
jgi:hypothetical protein